jgi:hypothetical protein
MPANDYHFVTHWHVEGTIQEVADVLGDALQLPRWWPAVYLDVWEIQPGDERGVGREIGLHTKGWLPYTLRWTFRVIESRSPYGFTIEAQGDFVGRGIWTLEQDGPWVDVTYDWQIRANKPLLRWLSPVLKPIFAANHRWAMARGEESLRLELARRRARTAEERALVPAPPPPTPAAPPWAVPVAAGAALALAALFVVARRPRRAREHRHGAFSFNPDRLAYLEAAGWRAYYDRNWPRLLRLLVETCREQFRMPLPQAVLAAYYAARGAAAWAPLRHDARIARRYYDRFYRLARRFSGLSFDPGRVAELEMRYWDDHRRLVGQEDKQAFVETLTRLHGALFGLPPAAARESAELRVRAANLVDGITGKRSTDVEGDWRRLEGYLRDCYRLIQGALHSASWQHDVLAGAGRDGVGAASV